MYQICRNMLHCREYVRIHREYVGNTNNPAFANKSEGVGELRGHPLFPEPPPNVSVDFNGI